MEDLSEESPTIPDTPMNNLARINIAFHDCCWPLLLSISHPCMILCDFPSRISDPTPNINIFGLDDLSLFVNTAIAHPECCIYVLTQQTYILKRLLNPPSPLPKPFWFLTRTSSNCPFELKIIEIINSLPNDMQDRITQFYFIRTFSVTLNGKKGPWIKQFDLFHLLLDPNALSTAIDIPTPPPFLQGIMFSEQRELITQASLELARINIPHNTQNLLQAKFPYAMECLSYQVPIPDQEVFHSICSAISSFTYLKSFNFMAILSAIYSSPDSASISFILIKKINLSPIIELFEHCNIQYFQTYNTFVFHASPTKLEEALLTALDIGISVPPSFLTSAKRIVFNTNEHCLQARILKFSDVGVVELQITRCDLCTTSDLYFTPSFLTLLSNDFTV